MEWSLLNFGVNQDPGYNFHKTSLKFEVNKYKQSYIVFFITVSGTISEIYFTINICWARNL